MLLVSNTNIAVDTALERIADCLVDDPGFNSGTVLRLGPMANDELKKRFGDKVQLEEVVARLGADLTRQRVAAEAQLKQLNAQVSPFRSKLEAFAALKQAEASLVQALSRLESEKSRSAHLRGQVATCEHSLESLKADLALAKSAGMLRRLFTGARPARVLREMGRIELERQSLIESANAAGHSAVAAEASCADLRSKVGRMRGALEGNATEPECVSRLAVANREITELEVRVRELELQLAALGEQVTKRCRVLAATVYRTFLKGQIDREFDVVVIDEASMLMLPLSYFAAGLARESVVVAGDFRQLPPIVQSEESLTEEWLRQDVFEKSDIPELLKSSLPAFVVALKEQYRMNEAICRCTNDLFYSDHRLVTMRQDPACAEFPLSNTPLAYVDTSAFHPWAAFRLGTWSRYNLLHALLVRNIANRLRGSCARSPAHGHDDALGIIAPYASQAKLIRALCSEGMDGGSDGLGATVHTFQGSERHTIVVDLPDSFGAWLGSFMKAKEPQEPGTRLMNVALSRARDHVVLVANFEYLRKKSPAGGVISRVLDYFEEHGSPIDVRRLELLGPAVPEDGLRHLGNDMSSVPLDEMSWHTEGTFYPAFSSDLKQARGSVLIFSPFLTQRGSSRWIEFFRAAIARGVCVRIVTRPPGDQGGVLEHGLAETIGELRAVGVTVDLRTRMHEKIVTIDDRVLWHGSLNVMSHNDTTESMFRIPSPAACQELGRLIVTPGRAGEEGLQPGAPENPSCYLCGSPMIWNTGRFGIYFTCERAGCDGKAESRGGRRSGSKVRKSKAGAGAATMKPCPNRRCGGHLRQRTGRYGAFLGCSNYPKCKQTQSVA